MALYHSDLHIRPLHRVLYHVLSTTETSRGELLQHFIKHGAPSVVIAPLESTSVVCPHMEEAETVRVSELVTSGVFMTDFSRKILPKRADTSTDLLE